MPTSAASSGIQAALDDCVAAGSPGALIVIHAPRLGFAFSGASGLFQLGTARQLQPDDCFRAASVTKAVTAATAVRLAAEGHWSLDSSITRFLPRRTIELLGRLEGLRSVDDLTLRRLLGHTSGLPDYFFDARFQERTCAEPDRLWRPEDLIESAVGSRRLAFPPGSDFAYGDTAYVLVGIAMERLLGVRLAEVYRRLIFAPLEMEATYLEWHEPARAAAVSHHYDGDRDLLPMNTSFDWAGGGLVTTAGDLVRFLLGLFGGALFDHRWLAELTAWRERLRWKPDSSARYLRYGLGLGTNVACGEEIIGATGVWGAFAYFWPTGGAAIAGTLNLRGANRSTLLDAVLCALGELRRNELKTASPSGQR
jgi:D-alanyl-D-alanine carboxypeptidase